MKLLFWKKDPRKKKKKKGDKTDLSYKGAKKKIKSRREMLEEAAK